jgi:predicted RND superfamily exporter protein
MKGEGQTPFRRALRAYVCAVVAHPWSVLLLVALVTAALSVRLGTLRVHVDVDSNLPQEQRYVRADAKIRALFGGRKVVAITVVPASGTIWNSETLGTIARLTEAADRIPGVIHANVLSLASPTVKDIRGTADGIEAHRIMASVPEDPKAIEGIRSALARNEIYIDSIVSARGDAAAIYLDFHETMDDEEIFRAVSTLVDAARARSTDAIYLTGMPSFVHYFAQFTRETVGPFGVAVVVIMAILYLAFPSAQGTLLPVATALLSTLWGLGLMTLAGATMDGWNSIAPILTVAVAAGHSVQILKRFYEEYERLDDVRAAVVESTVSMGVVMLTAGLIAAASFASLVAFGIATIRVFGLFTAAGIASALMLEMTFIPACRVLLPAPRRRKERPGALDHLMAATADAVLMPRRRRMLLAIAAVLFVVAAWASHRIVVNNSIRSFLPVENEARVGSNAIERYFGGAVPLYVLFEGDAEGALKEPAVLEIMAGLQAHLATVPGVSKTQSIADMVRLIYRALNGDDPAYDRIPSTRRLVAQCLLLYSISGAPDDFERLVNPTYTRALLRGFLANDQTQLVSRVVRVTEAYIAAHPPPAGIHVAIGGGGPTMLAMNEAMIHGKLLNILQVGGLIYAISALVLGSAVGGLYVLVPLVLAVVVNFGALGAFGIWLNMSTATISAMAVGIGADYAIYLLYRLREELARAGTPEAALRRTLATSGKAIVFVAAAISAGYASLVFASLEFDRMIARLVPLTMLVSATGALTVVPALLFIFRPTFLFRRVAREVPVVPMGVCCIVPAAKEIL